MSLKLTTLTVTLVLKDTKTISSAALTLLWKLMS